MSRMRKWIKCHRVLAVFAVMALGMAVFAPPTQAASNTVVNFDPSGGTVPNSVLNVSSWAFLPGNVDAIGGGGTLTVGQSIPVLYEAILGTINTTGANSGGTLGNTANISTSLGGSTGNQVVITAQFTEMVTAFNGTSVTFAPNLGAGTNALNIYAQSSSNANSANINMSSGVGFPTQPVPPGSTLILSGVITPTNFTSSFAENTSTDPRLGGTPVLLNQHTGGSGSYSGVNTIVGTGNTGLIAAVTFTNPNYFLSSTPFFSLTFSSISAATPFTAVDPQTTMFTGAKPSLGTVNGLGTDFLFQSQATTSFAVPEPSSILMGVISVGFVSAAGVWSRRRRKASATA